MVNLFPNWDAEDEKCPHCNQVTKQVRGITKQNLKRLLWSKPNLDQWISFFIIIMVILSAWAYQRDTAICREYVKERQNYYAQITPEETGTYNRSIGNITIPFLNAPT